MTLTFRSLANGALAAGLPVAALAQTTSQDALFARKAAQAGMAEVRLAHLAMRKSTNPAVLSFARHMAHDHGKANAQLTSIVEANGMTPPASVGTANAALMARLQGESGSAFDTDYLRSQLPAHRQVLALFKTEAANGQNSALVAFAKQTIPVIEHHIVLDRGDIAKVGGAVGMR
jgi:putative membrane protein